MNALRTGPAGSGRHALLLAVLSAALLLGCSPAGSAGAPDIVNAGFDQPSSDGLPPAWFLDAAAKGKGQIQLLASYPGATGNVLQLKPNGTNSGDKLLGLGQLLDAAAWRGRSIGIEVKMGASGGAAAIAGVHALGKSGDLGFVQIRQDDSGGELRLQRRSLDVPANADNLVVYVTTPSMAGQALIDSIALAVVGAPGAAPAPASSRVEISVDAQRVVRQIPPTIFGSNAEWIFDGQGLWSSGRKALDSDALRLVGELSPSVIRFPGGVFADYYHWRDGIGAQDRRPSTPNYPGGPQSRHAIGSQEIAEVARHARAELLLTVNAGSGTAAEAADWVAYAKRELRPRVRLWEVGNELYMKGDLSGAAMTAKQYAKRYLAFAAAMRAADPEIRIGAIGGLNYGSYRFMSDDRWTDTLLQQAAPQIDFLSVHNAYAPVLIGVSDSVDPKSVYRAMLAAPKQIEANLQDLGRMLARYESPTRPIALAVTEWGPSFHVAPSSPWVDHVKTMGSALFVASTLNVFARSPRVEVANFFKLTDHGFMGWLGRRKGAWAHTAPGLAFSLYREKLGRNLVQTDVSSPTYDMPGLGAVAPTDKVPWVDAIATYDKGQLVLMLVNKSDTQTLDGKITLKGVRAYSNVSVQSLSADSLDANTGTELPAVPGLVWAKQVDLGHFARGTASEIRVMQEALPPLGSAPAAGATLNYKLKPLSITAITFGLVELR